MIFIILIHVKHVNHRLQSMYIYLAMAMDTGRVCMQGGSKLLYSINIS